MITETDVRQIGSFTYAVRPQRVEVVEGNRALLSSAAAMPFHTDHPSVDVIAWFCESQSMKAANRC
jgi:hypothetical protein